MHRLSASLLAVPLVLAGLLAEPAWGQDAEGEIAAYEFGEAHRYEGASGFTASGEPYNPDRLTLAHASLPFGTLVEVAFRNRTVTARVNDRDTGGALVRLSSRAADQLGLPPNGGIVELSLNAQEVAFLRQQAARRTAAAGDDSATVRPRPHAVRSGRYTIQLASFSDEARAIRQAGSRRGTWVEPVPIEGQTVYRVYYGIYPSREAAGRALEVLTAEGLGGFVKEIAGGAAERTPGRAAQRPPAAEPRPGGTADRVQLEPTEPRPGGPMAAPGGPLPEAARGAVEVPAAPPADHAGRGRLSAVESARAGAEAAEDASPASSPSAPRPHRGW